MPLLDTFLVPGGQCVGGSATGPPVVVEGVCGRHLIVVVVVGECSGVPGAPTGDIGRHAQARVSWWYLRWGPEEEPWRSGWQ